MKLKHHGLEVELSEEWWAEAGMIGFEPAATCYRVDHGAYLEVREIRIEDVGPVQRNPGVGIFNNNDEASVRQRVVSILRGFRVEAAIPPVKVVEGRADYGYPYKLLRACIGSTALLRQDSVMFLRSVGSTGQPSTNKT